MSGSKEQRAIESLSSLLKAADACRILFDEAGMEYPAPLKRLLGMKDKTGQRFQKTRLP